MPEFAIEGAMLACTMGVAPCPLVVTPNGTSVGGPGLAIGTIDDMVPETNIASFGMCISLANPQVVAATAAALGVLTPQPCLPVIAAPWAPPSTSVTIEGVPALLQDATCECAWTGVISVTDPGQISTTGM